MAVSTRTCRLARTREGVHVAARRAWDRLCDRPTGTAPAAGQPIVRSGILPGMPDRRRSWKTDSQWVRLALAAGGVGVSLILAYVAGWKERPVFYIGAGLALVAVYISFAVLVLPLPLPPLLSERRNRAFRRGVSGFLVAGQELRGRPVAHEAELATLQADYDDWSVRAQAWLDVHARPGDAAAFAHVVGPAQEIVGSFDRAHNDLRLRLTWQIQVLRGLPGEA